MAKNRSMAIKHAKAKKCAMEEVMDNAKLEMCCKTIPNNIHYINHAPYSTNEIFYSKLAIQKRINILVGRYYPAEKFCEDWNEVYKYLATHTVTETKKYFGGTVAII